MKEYAREFYNSKPWRECRKNYAKSVGRLCERCLKRGIVKAGKIVHHKIWLTPENINDPSITLNFENLELLCQDCHNKEGGTEKRFGWDENGNVTPPRSEKFLQNRLPAGDQTNLAGVAPSNFWKV